MKISDLITYIRTELEDDKKTRWSDERLLSLVRRAFIRVSHLVRRNAIELGKSYTDIDIVVGQTEYDLPYDFMSPLAAFINNTAIQHRTLEQFNEISFALPLSNYIIHGDKIIFLGAPVATGTVRLYYYVLIRPEELTLAAETPYDGKLDMIVLEYLTLRAKNVDENEVSADVEFLKDLETAILDTYASLDPVVVTNRGWM